MSSGCSFMDRESLAIMAGGRRSGGVKPWKATARKRPFSMRRDFTHKAEGIVALVLLLCSLGGAQTVGQPPTLRVIQTTIAPDGRSQAVVSPIDGQGKALRGLVAANFQVSVAGREAGPLLLTRMQSGQVPLSLVLAMDISGSMRGAKMEGAVRGRPPLWIA